MYCLLFTALLIGQTRNDLLGSAPKQNLLVAQVETKAVPLNDYQARQSEAVAKGLPLAVFVGAKGRDIAGVVRCDVDSLAGVEAPAIVVGRIQAGQLYWAETLPITASDARILGKAVQAQRPAPFGGQYLLQTADVDGSGHGPWPKDFEFPKGFERYQPAKNTQEIAVTNGVDRITPVPRSALLKKWQVPGGLEVVDGWRSDTYRRLLDQPKTFIGTIQVLNVFRHFQPNRGWKREYADGSQFMDVLTNVETGEVFEIRLRTKENGQWRSEVDYRKRSARPSGYHGVSTTQCNNCHAEAGTGGYATGLVPGGDGVISDPFQALESK